MHWLTCEHSRLFNFNPIMEKMKMKFNRSIKHPKNNRIKWLPAKHFTEPSENHLYNEFTAQPRFIISYHVCILKYVHVHVCNNLTYEPLVESGICLQWRPLTAFNITVGYSNTIIVHTPCKFNLDCHSLRLTNAVSKYDLMECTE